MHRLPFVYCVLALAVSSRTWAADFYVAPHGDDGSAGTEVQPLATLQAAVNKLQPGDTLLIRGGVYRETVTFPRSGTAEKPITLKAYPGEQAVVSGCDPISGWTLHQGNAWKRRCLGRWASAAIRSLRMGKLCSKRDI